MSDVVVVVGPKAIVGRGAVDVDAATIALESVDDVLALVDDRVVSVDDLWRDVLEAAVDGPCGEVALICPSWWGPSRMGRVVAAARHCCDDVVVHRRSEVLAAAATVVELGSELVVVHADGRRNVITRGSHSADVVDAVVASVDGLPAVTVDVPSGTTLLGANLARALRLRGVEVTIEDDRTLADAVRGSPGSEAVTTGRWRPTPRAAGVVAAVLTVGGLTVAGIGVDGRTAEPDVAWLVEGRVAVEVPAGWTVERITAGPGSARVQVISPTGRSEAIQMTQSRVADTESLESTAEALTSALADQPGGVFVDFTATGERANRSAVTYREVRSDRSVDWTVLLDGEVRIAIGCQGPVAGPGPRAACDRAIRSAHAVERK